MSDRLAGQLDGAVGLAPSQLIRFGGAAAMTGGTLRVIAAAIPYQADSPGLEVFYAVIDICLLLGLVTLYVAAARRMGWLGLAAFTISFAALASIVGPDASAFEIDFYEAGITVLVIAMGLFGSLLVRARIFMWAAMLWIAAFIPAGASTILSPEIMQALSGLVFGLGFVAAGYALFRPASKTA